MTKKLFLFLSLVCLATGAAFSQNAQSGKAGQGADAPKGQKIGVGLDVAPLFKGFIAGEEDSDNQRSKKDLV